MAIYSSNIKRPRYFDRQQLTAEDLTLAQDYQIARRQQLTQHLHGWGVVCGAMLTVTKAEIISLSEGFAISPSGCSIHIPAITNLDFASLFKEGCGDEAVDCDVGIDGLDDNPTPTRAPENPTEEPKVVYLIARPIEVATDPQPAIPPDCAHQGNSQGYSRTCESVGIEIVCELPALHQTDIIPCEDLSALFCRRENANLARILYQHFSCPSSVAESDDYVVLASLITQIMPREKRRVVDRASYDSRRILLPTQTLQQYLACLCNTPQPTATPTLTATRFPTQTILPTLTATRLPTQTIFPTLIATRIPTLTATRLPTLIATRLPTLSATVFPTGISTRGPIGVLTRPIDPFIVGNIDVLDFDTVRGSNVAIDELVLLSDADKSSLRTVGINSVLDLYTTDTNEIANVLNVSEIRVAEYKDNALESMRRGETIALDNNTFDLERGMRLSVESVFNVGRVRGERLARAGLASVADMANAKPDTIRTVLSVSETAAKELIADAKSRMIL